MGKERFTREQLWAAETRGGTLLVSAAAGSGKTTVLVERVIGLLTDESSPVSADRLLIVTFMRDAAAEMRERLNKALSKKLEEEPDNLHLRRQKLLLQKATIGTIHSFCSSCLREFFASAGVAPDFRVAETSEIKLLQTEILSALIEEQYGLMTDDFSALVGILSAERDSSALSSLILQANAFVSAFPDPDEKLREIARMYQQSSSPDGSPWCSYILDYCRRYLMHLTRVLERAASIVAFSEIEDKYGPLLEKDMETVSSLLESTYSGWDCAYWALRSADFASAPRITGDPYGKQEAMAARKTVRDAVAKMAELVSMDGAAYSEDTAAQSRAVSTLCGLTLAYRQTLTAKKAEKRILEFDDLEHMTASLLFTETENGYERTDIACELSQRYDEILLDEYQDTNYTQDLIFRAISREGGRIIGDGTNMFMVGDIKQSIYRFRKAVPQLFLDRLDRYTPFNPDCISFPAKITLGKNFRSRPEVTESINFIFSQIMTAERGGVNYDSDEQRLFCGRSFPEASNRQTELHILSGSAAADDDTRDIVEARYCARLIKKMIDEGFEVTDGGELRPARYGDFCIMRRSIKGGHGDDFISQLSALGIPVTIAADSGFFAAPEVNVMMSLLRAIDNPLLDISLAAALRSPIFGFDCDRLALLRADGEKGSLYADLLAAANAGDEQCAAAVELLMQLRDLSAATTSDRLISAIYRKTGYLAAVQAADNGSAKRANLLLLLDYARTFEGAGFKGLSRFISMVDRLIEQGEDQAGAAVVSDNCVTIRTIHKSKGLEFPICILAGMGSKVSQGSGRQAAVFHNDLGIGMTMYDPDRRLRYPSVQRQAIALANLLDDTDEELRVLYVAMTRAVDKLILLETSSTRSDPLGQMKSAYDMIFDDGISPFALGLSPSCGKWVTACAMRHPNSGCLYQFAELEPKPAVSTDVPFDFHIVLSDAESLAPINEQEGQTTQVFEPDNALLPLIRERLDYVYPHHQLHLVPSKVTASGTHAKNLSLIASSRPSFMQEKGLSPTEKGTALHRFMQFCDFDNAAAQPEKELERLVDTGHLSAQEAAAVDLRRVNAFFTGEMAELLARTRRIEREWRFSAMLEPQYLHYFTEADAAGEQVVLEGECDLLLYTDDGIVIVDYKTDRVTAAGQLTERYTAQLELYASAVRQITGSDNVSCRIYSFTLSQLIDVN